MLSAVGAAKHHSSSVMAMTDNATAAMAALWRQGVNGAFEAVEIMGNAVYDNLQRFIIFVAANFAGLNACMELVFGLSCKVRFENARHVLRCVSFDHAPKFA